VQVGLRKNPLRHRIPDCGRTKGTTCELTHCIHRAFGSIGSVGKLLPDILFGASFA
jgi:hypothetical protein